MLVREDAPGDKRWWPTSCPTPPQSAELDAADLRAFLKQKLPEYMVPSAFVGPAGPAAHRQRQGGPQGPARAGRAALATRHRATSPRATTTEKQLAAIWREVLRVERVGMHDNFFALGGHSLLATQAVTRIRTTFNVEFSLQDFFEAPTVAELALNILRITAQVDLGGARVDDGAVGRTRRRGGAEAARLRVHLRR